MVKDGKENIDKNKNIPDVWSEKDKLSSLKNEINGDKYSEKYDISWEKENLSNLKKEVKEKNILKSEKENLSALAKEIKEKKNSVSVKKEILESSENSDSWKNSFLSKQIDIFSSWKEKNISRPVKWIESAYMDVTDQIENWIKDPNIVARWSAKLIKMIMQNEK